MKRLKMRERRSLRRYATEFGGTLQMSVLAFRFVSFVLPLIAFIGIGTLAATYAIDNHTMHSASLNHFLHQPAVIFGMAAMPLNINALRQQKHDLKNKGIEILNSGSLDDAKRTKLADFKTQLEQIDKDIQVVEAFYREELAPGAAVAAAAQPQTDSKGKKVYNRLSEQLVAMGMTPKSSKSEEMAPFSNIGEQMRAVYQAARQPQSADPRLSEINMAALGGNESVPEEGGFLVLPEFAAELIQRTYEVGLLTDRTFKMPMSSSRLIMHAVDEDSRKDGSRWGGIQAFWIAEAGSYTGSKPKFREMQFVSNKLIALCYATEEQLADGPAWAKYVSEAVPSELSFKFDTAIFNGAGAGVPLGFMNSGALITQTKEGGQAAGTIVTNNILKMWSRMYARSRKNAVWLINQDIEQQLYTLALANPTGSVLFQGPLYVPPGTNGNNGDYGLLLNKPVIPIEQASTLGTAGDITLADLSQYILAQRSEARADTSIHVAFLTGEQAFRFMVRADGQPTWKKPLTPYQGTITKSPFIALETR
jgi:HK97 family phage major capsid protein